MWTTKRVLLLVTCLCCALLSVVVGFGLSAPVPDSPRRKLEDYQRAEEEAIELEKSFTKQRIRIRSELLDKKEMLQGSEREATPHREKDAVDLLRLEGSLSILANPDTSPAAANLKRAIAQLRATMADREKQLIKLRKDLIAAEEQLNLLERQQEIQRRRVYAKLQEAEARLTPLPVLPPMPVTEQRFRQLEKKVDSLLREMEDLRREMRQPPKRP